MHHDQKKLNDAGYVTKYFTRYHFKVKRKGSDIKVNVWPTARKILKEFSPGPAEHYTDIVEAVKKLTAPRAPKTLKEQAAELRALYPIKITPAYRYLQWWKAKPMERLHEYIENI